MFYRIKSVVTYQTVALHLERNCFNISRNFSAAASANPDLKAQSELEWGNALPYSKIPSVGLRHFLPGGQFYNIEFKKFHNTLNQKYGKIVKINGIPGRKDIVCTYDPNDFEKVLRTEGVSPVRNGNESLSYYRKKVRPEVFESNGGLVAEQGEKWQTFRTKVNPVMLQPKIVKQYVPGIDQIAMELSQKIKQTRDSNNQVWNEFSADVHKWAIESICYIALDTRLNTILNDDPNSEGYKMVVAAREIFANLFELELSASLWRYYKTPLFKKLMKNFDGITDIILNCIQRSLNEMEAKKNDPKVGKEESILQKLIKIDRPTAVTMAADMLLAGADTTGAMALTVLYALSRNPEKQQKLREEILTFLPTKDSSLEPQHLANIPYLRACLKEAVRLNPPVIGNFRQSGQDLVLQGYRVPKGIDISMGNLIVHGDAEQFPEPNKFIPERWLKSSAEKFTHPFAFLPFGFGARSCIGRRFAELEVECLVARLLRDYEIVWNSKEELKYHSDFINAPVGKLHFVFNDVKY